ncbi:uncharacterized protein SPAPADRAFT_51689 [Spathaspora passalidarum NRRL Y-27907]|uniref:Uncharacterized protein n=1 Tax=Spathaspora passalidarum (strain NRRL Y-27907 / 11-Y1) TaxID=619300 RepID=G3ARA1_SPAPN|nr:uncharacterized protein SPAPADRAFT_51689 [Spathaspora passalidarum NRRL Y-27907]EGW31708.1 hypothetical protein SPAPADRAFT_51689 [Spathaspora passalidarum NRRL Y-27907]
MVGLRPIHNALSCGALIAPGMKLAPILARSFATTTPKFAQKHVDMADIPIANIGAMADFYVPPRIWSQPMKYWPVLLGRRFLVFASNTYSIVKYKQETGNRLDFNRWKDEGIEKFVKMNKVFAAACNQKVGNLAREKYLVKNLQHECGSQTIARLLERVVTFPLDSTVKWDLVSIEKNPKIVSFNAIPDRNNVVVYVQFIMKLVTKQKMTITTDDKEHVSEVTSTDYLVYTLNPHTKESVLVGKLFESNPVRKVSPDYAQQANPVWLKRFTAETADIYRTDPRLESKDN